MYFGMPILIKEFLKSKMAAILLKIQNGRQILKFSNIIIKTNRFQ